MLMSSMNDIRYQNQEIEKIYNMNEIIYDATQERVTELDATLWNYIKNGFEIYFQHPYFAGKYAFTGPKENPYDTFPIKLKSIEFLTLSDYINQSAQRNNLQKFILKIPLYKVKYQDNHPIYEIVDTMIYPTNLNKNGTIFFELYTQYDSVLKEPNYFMYIITTGTKILIPNNLNNFFALGSSGNSKARENLEQIKFNNIVKIKNNENSVSLKRFCSGLRKLNFIDFQTLEINKVNNLEESFYNCRALTSLNISNITTENNTDASNMLMWCRSLTNLNLSNFDTSNIINMSGMFYYCTSLTSLDVSNFDTSNVQSMSSMFENCNSLTSLNLSSFDTSNVKSMYNMFNYCISLTSLDVFNFDTSNVKDMRSMFEHCQNLTSLDLSNFDTSKVENMSDMFADCNNLISLDISNFNTTKVGKDEYDFKYSTLSFENMFANCKKLTNLSISNFSTSKFVSVENMFSGCSSLTLLNLSNFNLPKTVSINSMLEDCSSLRNIQLNNFIYNQCLEANKVFKNCSSLQTISFGNCNFNSVWSISEMFYNCSSLNSIDLSTFIKSNDFSSSFYNCSSLNRITIPSNWVGPVLNNMPICNSINYKNAFEGCTNLTEVTIPLVEQFACSQTFKNCESLKRINFFFGTTAPSHGNEMTFIYNNGMTAEYHQSFYNCYELEQINFPSGINQIKICSISDLESCFENCYKLNIDNLLNKIIYLSFSMYYEYNESYFEYQPINCKKIFKGCRNFTNYNLENIHYPTFKYSEDDGYTGKLIFDFDSCFEDCINLKKVATNISLYKRYDDPGNIDCLPYVLKYQNLFKNCTSLTDVFLYGFHYFYNYYLEFPTYYCKDMFYNCINLENIYVENESPFNTNIQYDIFDKGIEWDSKTDKYPVRAFYNCTKLPNWGEGGEEEGHEEEFYASVIHAKPVSGYWLSWGGEWTEPYFQFGTRKDIFPQS